FAATYSTQKTDSYAAFAQATFPIFSDDTHLTLGARYTVDHREITAHANLGNLFVGPVSNCPQSDKWSKPTMPASLDHQSTDVSTAYVACSRGLKSGLFNAVVFPGGTIGEPVKPETLDAYSIGTKTEFLDKRLRINAEAFYYSYKNIQITQIVPGGTSLS